MDVQYDHRAESLDMLEAASLLHAYALAELTSRGRAHGVSDSGLSALPFKFRFVISLAAYLRGANADAKAPRHCLVLRTSRHL